MLDLVLTKLAAEHQVQLGLCCKNAKSIFWKCLGSKIWYCSVYISNSRSIRKLCLSSSMLNECPVDKLDKLTHLHIYSNSDDVEKIVLPRNLRYCFLERTRNLMQCTLPVSLQFFETNDSGVHFIGLENHPNLTVLRIPNLYDRCMLRILPPNLVELETDTWDVGAVEFIVLPAQLVRLTLKIRSSSRASAIVRSWVFPDSLMHVSLKSEYPVFDVSMSANSKLSTLRTTGNVFATKVQFPESLRLFRVRLGATQALHVNWHALSDQVDFQIIRE